MDTEEANLVLKELAEAEARHNFLSKRTKLQPLCFTKPELYERAREARKVLTEEVERGENRADAFAMSMQGITLLTPEEAKMARENGEEKRKKRREKRIESEDKQPRPSKSTKTLLDGVIEAYNKDKGDDDAV